MGFKETYQKKKIERDQFIAALNPKSFDFQLSTWFGSGLIIPAPGTWGTIGGMIFGIPLLLFTNSLVVLIVALILFFIGLKSVERLEKKLSDHDPSFIVIDEVAAILLLISLIPNQGFSSDMGLFVLNYFIAFGLFRLFDAWKPLLIGIADRKIKGAWGVMVDDIIAALFAYAAYWVVLYTLLFLIFPSHIS